MTDETDIDGEVANQGYLPSDPSVFLLPENSMISDIILNHIQENAIACPQHNLQ